MVEIMPIDIFMWCLIGFISLLGILGAILYIWEDEHHE